MYIAYYSKNGKTTYLFIDFLCLHALVHNSVKVATRFFGANLWRHRSHMLIPASRIKVTIFSDNLIYKFSTFRSFWLHCFSLSIWMYRTIYASDLKQEVKLSFCFTVFDQVVMNEQNSNMWLKVREYKTTWLVMRDKLVAKCIKYNNNNLVSVIICFSRFVSVVSVVSVVSFRWFRFGGFVSLFLVLVHAHIITVETGQEQNSNIQTWSIRKCDNSVFKIQRFFIDPFFLFQTTCIVYLQWASINVFCMYF